MADAKALDNDHVGLSDTFASRRYFAKFERITAHLTRVAAVMQAEGDLNKTEVEVLTRYVQGIAYTFKALSMKYLLVGRDTGQFFGSLAMDVTESGFPVFNELLVMANDAQQARRHLDNLPDEATLQKAHGGADHLGSANPHPPAICPVSTALLSGVAQGTPVLGTERPGYPVDRGAGRAAPLPCALGGL